MTSQFAPTAQIARTDVETVLVADDDADVRELVCEVLNSLGLATRAVARGDDAVLAIRSQAPRLLVLDVHMPGLSGLEICELVKRSELGSTVSVLLISANADPDDLAAGLAAGADGYLPKPFSCAELTRRVDALLAVAVPA